MKYIFLSLLFFSLNSIAQQPCDANKQPIVFVHGFLASGDSWSTQVQRFKNNGYCENQLFVFDWNTIGSEKSDSLLEVFIKMVLTKTSATQLNLVSHSAGGGLCFSFLKDSMRSKLVSHYVHIGSVNMTGAAGTHNEIPTMNIFSPDDKVVKGTFIDGVTNIKEDGMDHLQVATSVASFEAMYSFFNEEKMPAAKEMMFHKTGKSTISGRAVTLGENTPLSKDSIFLYEFDAQKGERISKKPIVLITDSNGYWPSTFVNSNSYVEFELRPKNGRVIHYFIEPQATDNNLIYLRSIATTGIAGKMLHAIPKNDTTVALAIFSTDHAIVYGRDSLTIDGINLSTPELTTAKKTIVASFLFDDGDGITSAKAIKSFGIGVFLNAVDVFIKADSTQHSSIYYNGKRISLPRIASKDGVMVAIFN